VSECHRIEYRRPVTISLSDIQKRMGRFGLGHVGVLPVCTYDLDATDSLKSAVLAPSARSILVLANGGRGLWNAFVEGLRIQPDGLIASQHPLDDFVQRSVDQACVDLGMSGHTVFFSDEQARVHLDFRGLAVSAGIGVPSRLGLVIHPKYGPWMGLRAAIFMEEEFAVSNPVEDVCGGCSAPCIPACPGGAMETGQWDVGACVDFHHSSTTCSVSCAARSECIVAPEARYDPLEILYHSNRRLGRDALREHLGVDVGTDRFEGQGPDWGPIPQL
jgi:hypothetical protein